MGAVIICAEAVHTSVKVFQVNFLVILEKKKKYVPLIVATFCWIDASLWNQISSENMTYY